VVAVVASALLLPILGLLVVLVFVFVFGFEFFRNNQGVFEHFLEREYLYTQLIHLVQIPKLIITIVTWGDANGRPGGLNLLGLYLARLQPTIFKSAGHWDKASTPTATKIVLIVGLHLYKILAEVFDNLPSISGAASVTAYITWILVSTTFISKDTFVQLNSSFPQIFSEQGNTVHHFKFVVSA
jgi:hypothetical protein